MSKADVTERNVVAVVHDGALVEVYDIGGS